MRALGPALVTAAALALLTLGLLPPASSMPRLMDKYNEHPRTVAQHRDKCVICHVNASGAGALTSFGDKYERGGLRFTDELMAEYPNLFATAAGGAAPAVASAASAPAPNDAPVPVVPGNEAQPFDAARYFKQECAKCHGKYGDGDPLQGVPAFATRKWIEERLPKTDELLHMILKGKDKMIGQERKITEEQARELLEHIRSIARQYGS